MKALSCTLSLSEIWVLAAAAAKTVNCMFNWGLYQFINKQVYVPSEYLKKHLEKTHFTGRSDLVQGHVCLFFLTQQKC